MSSNLAGCTRWGAGVAKRDGFENHREKSLREFESRPHRSPPKAIQLLAGEDGARYSGVPKGQAISPSPPLTGQEV